MSQLDPQLDADDSSSFSLAITPTVIKWPSPPEQDVKMSLAPSRSLPSPLQPRPDGVTVTDADQGSINIAEIAESKILNGLGPNGTVGCSDVENSRSGTTPNQHSWPADADATPGRARARARDTVRDAVYDAPTKLDRKKSDGEQEDDTYVLPRTYLSSSRLNYQFYLWCETLPFPRLLHPCIPVPPPWALGPHAVTTTPPLSFDTLPNCTLANAKVHPYPITPTAADFPPPLPPLTPPPALHAATPAFHVADVATGTAIWPIQVARHLPTSASLCGFDISLSQVPPRAWLPPNLELREWDIFTPLPEDCRAKYDVVHVRLLLLVLTPSTLRGVVRRLSQMLRDGGWLQWEEMDLGASYLQRADGELAATGALPTLESALEVLQRERHRSWLLGLEDALGDEGFEEVQIELYRDRAQEARAMFEMYLIKDEELLARSHHRLDEAGREAARRRIDDMYEESRRGAVLCTPKLVYMARKRSGGEWMSGERGDEGVDVKEHGRGGRGAEDMSGEGMSPEKLVNEPVDEKPVAVNGEFSTEDETLDEKPRQVNGEHVNQEEAVDGALVNREPLAVEPLNGEPLKRQREQDEEGKLQKDDERMETRADERKEHTALIFSPAENDDDVKTSPTMLSPDPERLFHPSPTRPPINTHDEPEAKVPVPVPDQDQDHDHNPHPHSHPRPSGEDVHERSSDSSAALPAQPLGWTWHDVFPY